MSPRIMLCGDAHLGHRNIHKYRTQFTTAEEHHETIWENIKSSVNKRDTLIMMGDTTFTHEWLFKLRELNCNKKILIAGNHCTENGINMREIASVYDEVHAALSYRGYWLTHIPMHPQELRGKKGNVHGHCISEDTEILTPNGWVSYDNIKVGNETYSYSGKSLVLDKVKSVIINKNYTGKTIQLKNRSFDMDVTDKHRVVFTSKAGIFKEVLADNMPNIMIINRAFSNTTNSSVILEDNMLRLYIVLAADGNITNTNLCRVGLKKERKKEKLIELLNKLNIEFRVFPQKSGVINYHFALPKELANWNIKGLDTKLLACSEMQVAIVKETYQWTDGNRDLIFTSKKAEKDLLQHLFTINGYICNALSRAGHGFAPQNESYQLSVTKGTTRSINKVKTLVKTTKVTNKLYWCIEQTNNSNFIARKGGIVFLTGNCHENNVWKNSTRVQGWNEDGSEPYYEQYDEIDERYISTCLEHHDWRPVPWNDLIDAST